MAGLYIHIPFCKQKCNYCDFHFSVSLKKKTALLKALEKEIVMRKNEIQEPIETIYFGGGTPSVLSYKEIASLLETIYFNYTVKSTAEITLEANPDDLSLLFLKEVKGLGFNRLSVGVQSFFDTDLQFMNRAHTAKEAIYSIKNAQDIGFSNITIDLIYGVPSMSLANWNNNLEKFLSLNIPHLSSYALTVEPHTVLAHLIKKNRIKPLDDALAKTHFHFLIDFMNKNNFVQYELSNFAKEGSESKHNSSYWQGKTYLGFGPSAHSFNQKTRSWNVANNARYMKVLNSGVLPLEIEVLTPAIQYNEYIMTGLRTIWGVSLSTIEKEFGMKYALYFKTRVERFITQKNLYWITKDRLGVQAKDFFLVDGIIADLFWLNR